MCVDFVNVVLCQLLWLWNLIYSHLTLCVRVCGGKKLWNGGSSSHLTFYCKYIFTTVTNLVLQIPVVCRPLWHQRCSIHYHRLYPIHHLCTLQLFPRRVLSHQPDECHHGCNLFSKHISKSAVSFLLNLSLKRTLLFRRRTYCRWKRCYFSILSSTTITYHDYLNPT